MLGEVREPARRRSRLRANQAGQRTLRTANSPVETMGGIGREMSRKSVSRVDGSGTGSALSHGKEATEPNYLRRSSHGALQSEVVAEGEGFEPSIRFPVYTLSRRAPSTTRPPLHCRALSSGSSRSFEDSAGCPSAWWRRRVVYRQKPLQWQGRNVGRPVETRSLCLRGKTD